MKRIIFLSLAIVSVLFFLSCEETDDGIVDDQNQFLYTDMLINERQISTSKIETTNTFIRDFVCLSKLPGGYLQDFSINVYIEFDEETQIEFGNTEFILYYGGTFIRIEHTLTPLRIETVEGKTFSKYLLEGQFLEEEVTKNNFQQLYFGFDMIYKNLDTDEEVKREAKFIEINFNPC